MRKHGLATREFDHRLNSVHAGGNAITSVLADGNGGGMHLGDGNSFCDNGFSFVH